MAEEQGCLLEYGAQDFEMECLRLAAVRNLPKLRQSGNMVELTRVSGLLREHIASAAAVLLENMLGRSADVVLKLVMQNIKKQRVNLDGDGVNAGPATFAADGTEQDVLAEYILANFGDETSAFDMADTGRDQDTRIQNIEFREDTVIDAPEAVLVEGTEGRDRLTGTDADEIIISGAGRYDTQSGGLGADVFIFGAETQNGVRERDIITDYEVGIDVIGLAEGTTIADIRATSSSVVVYFDDSTGAQDALYVRGDGVTTDTLSFETFDTLAFA